jgi:hypothetical protein
MARRAQAKRRTRGKRMKGGLLPCVTCVPSLAAPIAVAAGVTSLSSVSRVNPGGYFMETKMNKSDMKDRKQLVITLRKKGRGEPRLTKTFRGKKHTIQIKKGEDPKKKYRMTIKKCQKTGFKKC